MVHVCSFIVASALAAGPVGGGGLASVIASAGSGRAGLWGIRAEPQTTSEGPARVRHARAQSAGTSREASQQRAEATREARETRTFKVEPDGELTVSNLTGSITVTGRSGSEVRVEVVRRASGETDAEARKELESSDVSFEQRAGRLDIQAGQRSLHHVETSFNITVPQTMLVDVRSMSGDITLRALKGETRAETMSGDIRATDVAALTSVKTMSGDLGLADCGAAGEVSASSVSGDVTVERVKARACSFGSVSGEIRMKQVACGRAVVRTVAGDLTFDGPLDRGGRYEFKTHSGNVQLAIAGDTGFEIDARSFNGELRSDLPLAGSGDRNQTSRGRPALRGVYGDGSADISVTTFSGDVRVARRAGR